MIGGRSLRFGSLAAVGALAACATPADYFGQRGLEFNRQIEHAQNETLFLNIVRAAYRRPQVYTTLTGATGQATVQAQLGFALPFADNLAPMPFQASPSIMASSTPSFTLSNLSTAEFTKAILKPLTVQSIDLFGREGLAYDELFRLFFKEALITWPLGDGSTRTLRIENIPTGKADDGMDPRSSRDFGAVLDALRDADLETEAVNTETPVGPPLALKSVLDVAALVKLNDAKLKVSLTKGAYQVSKPGSEIQFCFANASTGFLKLAVKGEEISIPIPPKMRCGSHAMTAAAAALPPAAEGRVALLADTETTTSKRPGPASPTLSFTLRSTQGVIYFLGELLRCQETLTATDERARCEKFARVLRTGSDEASYSLFEPRVRAPGEPAGAHEFLSVDYAGKVFSIGEGSSGDRTTQTLALVQQLVALNSSAKDLPASNVVTLIGR